MKNIWRTVLLLAIVFLALVPFLVVHAASPLQVVPPPDLAAFLQAVLAIFVTLVGFPSALAAVINLLIKFNVITDAVAGWVSFAANAIMFLVVAYFVFTGQSAVVATIDSVFVGLAKLLADILIVVGGFGVSFLSTAKYSRAIAEHGAAFRATRMLYHPK